MVYIHGISIDLILQKYELVSNARVTLLMQAITRLHTLTIPDSVTKTGANVFAGWDH